MILLTLLDIAQLDIGSKLRRELTFDLSTVIKSIKMTAACVLIGTGGPNPHHHQANKSVRTHVLAGDS